MKCINSRFAQYTKMQDIKEVILHLEEVGHKLEPSHEERRNIMEKAFSYTDEFIENIDNIKAYEGDQSKLSPLDESELFEFKSGMDQAINLLARTVDSVGINPASPGHFGYIPGGGIFASAIGDLLAAVTNRYAGLYYASPGAVKLENKLLRWACDIVGYPDSALGNITTGGSIANLIALTTARDKKGVRSDKISTSVIYITSQTHHCIQKAARIAGLSECPVRKIKLDKRHRMDMASLEAQILEDIKLGLNPFYIAASAGSTDTGACDDLDQMVKIAKKYNAWSHVDAAYGGFFILVNELKHLFKGIEEVDSIVLDPHKSLFLPYGTGIILIKDGKALFDSYHYKANYLQDAYGEGEEAAPCDLSPELTKHFRGLRMWLPLQLHGLDPFVATLKEKWLLTKYFYSEVQKLGFEVGPEPDLSVCIYRYVPPNRDPNLFNAQLTTAIQKDGTIFISTTNIEGVFWLRIALVCFRSHLKQVDRYLQILKLEVENLLRTENVPSGKLTN